MGAKADNSGPIKKERYASQDRSVDAFVDFIKSRASKPVNVLPPSPDEGKIGHLEFLTENEKKEEQIEEEARRKQLEQQENQQADGLSDIQRTRKMAEESLKKEAEERRELKRKLREQDNLKKTEL